MVCFSSQCSHSSGIVIWSSGQANLMRISLPSQVTSVVYVQVHKTAVTFLQYGHSLNLLSSSLKFLLVFSALFFPGSFLSYLSEILEQIFY